MTTYQNARNTRRESITNLGRFRGGMLSPVAFTAVRPSEGGMLSQQITYELDPIAGRMVTPMYAELTVVFVPVQAMDALKNPDADYPGLTEVVREKYLSGNPLFVLENENEISKRCRINPRSIGGVKKVSETIRLGHNAAVNFLRTRKYVKATKLLASSTASTPALISRTSLEMLNGVLDPDDRINGEVQLALPTVQLPVYGIGTNANPSGAGALAPAIKESNSKVRDYAKGYSTAVTGNGVHINVTPSGHPHVFAQLDAVAAGGLSLTDLYNAEKKDSLVRILRQIVDENSEYGEEMAVRYAHGMSVDPGRNPFILSEQRVQFGRNLVGASDTTGVQENVRRSDMAASINVMVPVPKTELGGVIMTFASLKPDETLAAQPHPFLSDNWGVDNFLADELALDPVPVTIRDLSSNPPNAAAESTRVMYTGHNALKQTYVSYGLSRQLDPTTVENKTAIWQLEIPLSVTPDNILYPADLPHYPFADQLAEVCTFTIASNMTLGTPMILGPTPVETLAIIDSDNLFGDDE
ncbi:hypothetical protein [Paracoccus sp. IB05]|uniref:hypothetical protein n=1 Tax=Paracoccus sp. IB05 TaxID=2779367 RepID=UPI0018E6E631|nr:hypothetical protein [Paracoccus sp. IB05]MBJ2150157.1 hypothetical protein [Paracoccus sp. IB05]